MLEVFTILWESLNVNQSSAAEKTIDLCLLWHFSFYVNVVTLVIIQLDQLLAVYFHFLWRLDTYLDEGDVNGIRSIIIMFGYSDCIILDACNEHSLLTREKE